MTAKPPSFHVLLRSEETDGTPAGFERSFARRAAEQAGAEPPEWALQPAPQVVVVGPRIGEGG